MLLTLLQSAASPAPVEGRKIGGDDAPRVEIWEVRKAAEKRRKVRRTLYKLREELPAEQLPALPPVPIRPQAPDWAAYIEQLQQVQHQLRVVQREIEDRDDEEVLMLWQADASRRISEVIAALAGRG